MYGCGWVCVYSPCLVEVLVQWRTGTEGELTIGDLQVTSRAALLGYLAAGIESLSSLMFCITFFAPTHTSIGYMFGVSFDYEL